MFRFLFLPLGLRFLSSAFTLLPVTQLPVLLFSFLPGSPHSGSPVLLGFFRPLGFFPSVTPDFSCASSGSAYSAFLYCFLSSFPASLPQPFGRCSSLAFTQDVLPWLPLSFVHFRFRLLTTQLLLVSFPLFHCFRLAAWLPQLLGSGFPFPFFLFLPAWFPVPSLRF